jgi:diaminopimelate epimerase
MNQTMPGMKVRFTKMQGAGNDFVVLDATQALIPLTPSQLRHLGDRRFGVGADQILLVERSQQPGIDFRYRIFNNTGDEVEHCGNGARCFARYVHDKGLSQKTILHVETVNNHLLLTLQKDGRVTVNMGSPVFDLLQIPFDSQGLSPRRQADCDLWPMDLGSERAEVAVLSMGNPHAVLQVFSVDTAPVLTWGPHIESHWRFPRKVNVGFMQIIDRTRVRLRVFERGAGETLACGTGACAAVVAGIMQGLLDEQVDVQALGGLLTISWAGHASPVLMTGPAETVFEGEIEL